MIKFCFPIFALACVGVVFHPSQSRAEDDPISIEETAAGSVKDRPEWNENLKTTYSLTDGQISELKARGLNYPQIAISSQLALKSGKPVDEILRMRMEERMGWGQIANMLGVPPNEIGHSIREMRHKMRDRKMIAIDERRAERLTKKAEKKAARMKRAAEKSEKKSPR